MTTPLDTLRAALRAYDLSGPLTKERNQATYDVVNAARTLALSGTPETPSAWHWMSTDGALLAILVSHAQYDKVSRRLAEGETLVPKYARR